MFDFLSTASGLTLTLLGIATALIGLYAKLLHPVLKRRQEDERRKEEDRIATRDAILGRPAIPDTTRPGHILHAATPGLPERMDASDADAREQRTQMAEMSRALVALAESHKHQGAQDKILADHERRLDKLEEGAVERVVTRAESAAAWRAMEAAALAKPDVESEPDL